MYIYVSNLLMNTNRTVYSYNSFTVPDVMCRKTHQCQCHANRLQRNKSKGKDDLLCQQTQCLVSVRNLFQTGLHHAVNKALSLQDSAYVSLQGQQISCNLEFVASFHPLSFSFLSAVAFTLYLLFSTRDNPDFFSSLQKQHFQILVDPYQSSFFST